MANPFENENGSYYSLINEEGQYSLWPTFVALPKGWTAVYGPGSRAACLKIIEQKWANIQPNKLKATN